MNGDPAIATSAAADPRHAALLAIITSMSDLPASWIRQNPVSTWNGIKLDASGNIIEITPGSTKMKGQIRLDLLLEQLPTLKVMDFRGHLLSGTFSTTAQLRALPLHTLNLCRLDATESPLTGNFDLAHLPSSLLWLDLSDNLFTIKNWSAVSQLPALVTLMLQGNDLSSAGPIDLSLLPRGLKMFSVSSCKFAPGTAVDLGALPGGIAKLDLRGTTPNLTISCRDIGKFQQLNLDGDSICELKQIREVLLHGTTSLQRSLHGKQFLAKVCAHGKNCFANPNIVRRIAVFVCDSGSALLSLRRVSPTAKAVVEDAEDAEIGRAWGAIPMDIAEELARRRCVVLERFPMNVPPSFAFLRGRVRSDFKPPPPTGTFVQQSLVRRGNGLIFMILTTGRMRWMLRLALRHKCITMEYLSRYYLVNGHRPLHTAAAAGQIAVVELLLEFGADPREPDYNGRKAVEAAMMRAEHNPQLVDLLVGGFSSPHAAVLSNNKVKVRECILATNNRDAAQAEMEKEIIDYQEPGRPSTNLFGVAARLGYAESLQELCDFIMRRPPHYHDTSRFPDWPPSVDPAQFTLLDMGKRRLMTAAERETRETARMSIICNWPMRCSSGALADLQGAPPLLLAVQPTPQHLRCFQILAETKPCDLNGRTLRTWKAAVHLAVRDDLPQFVRALKAASSKHAEDFERQHPTSSRPMPRKNALNLNVLDYKGETAKDIARKMGRSWISELITAPRHESADANNDMRQALTTQ